MKPDFAAFSRRWTQGKNQTLSLSIVSDVETPVSAMLKLGQGKPYCFLLESIEGGAIRGRYSIIGREPDLIWRCGRNGKAETNRTAQTNPNHFAPCLRPPIEDLRALLAECSIDEPDQPQPMAAGLFGYLGYDMVRHMERLPDDKPTVLDVPDAVLIRPTLLAIFDQIDNIFTLVTPIWFDSKTDARTAFEAATARLDKALVDLNKAMPVAQPLRETTPDVTLPTPSVNMSEDGYIANVEKSKEYIRAGDIFQVVLSQRFSVPFTPPALDLYRAIRRLDPSPFLYFFDLGDFSVVGSSPEILVRLRDGTVTIRPIAGTRPRYGGNKTDKELEEELLADPKELAEHLMLLDLGRNDIGRVAKIGTVKVTARNTIEYYKHVMHIVSNVEGELDKQYTALDALSAGFPAGTLTGAPKVRAMQIIQELESDRRGIYGGCIGYFGANGTMDTAIAIRTAVVKDGMAHVQAGAGVVYDSDPQAEYRECQVKARSMLKAAQVATQFARSK